MLNSMTGEHLLEQCREQGGVKPADSMNSLTATLVHHDHYSEGWHQYQLSAPVLCTWLRTDHPVTGIVVAHATDPLDGGPVTLVTHAGADGHPDPAQEWRTLDGDQVPPTELVRWILTRHGRGLPQSQ